MTAPPRPRQGDGTSVDLARLGLDRGGHLLLKRGLAGVAVGERLALHGHTRNFM